MNHRHPSPDFDSTLRAYQCQASAWCGGDWLAVKPPVVKASNFAGAGGVWAIVKNNPILDRSIAWRRAPVAVLLPGILVVAIACTTLPPDQAAAPGATGDDVASSEYPVVNYPDQGREHLTTGSPAPAYNSNPPTSGPHAPNTVLCGIHAEPVPDVVAVHNLEHGVVVIHYLPTIPREDISSLMDAVAGLESHFVVAPRPNNPAPITLSAWSVQLNLDEVDVAAVRWFWDEYSGQGPEAVDCPIQFA